MTRNEAVNFLLTKPYKLGHALGFTKLTELHNGWIVDMDVIIKRYIKQVGTNENVSVVRDGQTLKYAEVKNGTEK